MTGHRRAREIGGRRRPDRRTSGWPGRVAVCLAATFLVAGAAPSAGRPGGPADLATGPLDPATQSASTAVTPDSDPVARAVLFYSPTCPHCLDVIRDHLPPMAERYGDRLALAGLNVAEPAGQRLYQAMVDHFLLPRERMGVPTLAIGAEVLVGAGEIRERLPGLVDRALERGGVGWPAVPGLETHLEGARDQSREPGLGSGLGLPTADRPGGLLGPFLRDPVANGVAVAVLILMTLTLLVVGGIVVRRRDAGPPLPSWLIPVLLLAGTGIAAYLSWVETTGAPAVCGPVGDCNAVQQSPYATLFGVPVGYLGIAGYAAMTGAWLLTRVGEASRRRRAWLALWVMALAGTAFSAWLTFLEAFVIGATCIWCVTSAVIMTAILVLATPWAARARRAGPRSAARCRRSPGGR